MAEQKTYECDRCGTIFYGRADWEVPVLTLDVYWGGGRKEDPEVTTLCDKCGTSYSTFMGEDWKQFDKLADQILKTMPVK